MTQLRRTDRQGVDQVLDAISLLRADPRPQGARPYGSGFLRIHVGRYRVLYHVRDGSPVVISVEMVGRVP
ncbi:type II toxin-antitoxin system RelE/ParE family toxin [Streptomyces sp. HNM0663]|uniref:Type II toxin-antitoxin system RelE/ParE family toxin n=1 Tax=Streptomyces chengmaiensis TaxID=3040919 RepID=A0ABT6HJJ6_9ACTN|nr:type II toxin-antitoxin system RelE/ParE family toxin [Streptomyces chengmaiensis]MDH2388775.1 type II toxin-antitoxin system RelE/ParE family toxin [Streptomyces chengmaiensis]